jgi:hypothetical protein
VTLRTDCAVAKTASGDDCRLANHTTDCSWKELLAWPSASSSACERNHVARRNLPGLDLSRARNPNAKTPDWLVM